MVTTAARMVPLAQGTLIYRMTREKLLRRAQAGEIPAEIRGSRWYVGVPQEDGRAAADEPRNAA